MVLFSARTISPCTSCSSVPSSTACQYSYLRLTFRIILHTSQLPRGEAGGKVSGGVPSAQQTFAC